jgi:hypothetical protein
MPSFQVLEAERAVLLKNHPGWRIWYVPNALDGTVTWCAQHEPLLHADTPEHLAEYMVEADADIAKALGG